MNRRWRLAAMLLTMALVVGTAGTAAGTAATSGATSGNGGTPASFPGRAPSSTSARTPPWGRLRARRRQHGPGGGRRDVLGPPGSLDAYDDAVAWLRGQAYRLDPDTIVAAGFSAGAVTAANLAYLPGRRGPTTSPVAGAVVDSGLVYTVLEHGPSCVRGGA